MSKRIFLIVAIILALLAALPLIGNMSVSALIDSELQTLRQNGVGIIATDDESSYLLTRKHYRFLLKDEAKLRDYLQTFSQAQVPSYLYGLLGDVEVAADLSYSNLPFQDDITLELYPAALTKRAAEKLRRSDPKLLASLEEMIAEKALLYHLNYNTAAQSFNGYLKDLKEQAAFEDGTMAEITLHSVTFRGNGPLAAPKEIAVAVKEAESTFDHPEKGKMRFAVEGFRNESSFSAENSYETAYSMQNASLFFEEQNATFDFRAEEVALFSSTAAKLGKISGISDLRCSRMSVGDENSSLTMQNIALKLAAEGIDEAAFEKFQAASRRGGETAADLIAAMAHLEAIIAKGFSFTVDTFRVESLSVDGGSQMNGFEHTLQMVVRPDNVPAQKLGNDPKRLLENIDANISLRFADDFYTYLKKNGLMTGIDAYARADGERIVFDIALSDGAFVINGRPLNESAH